MQKIISTVLVLSFMAPQAGFAHTAGQKIKLGISPLARTAIPIALSAAAYLGAPTIAKSHHDYPSTGKHIFVAQNSAPVNTLASLGSGIAAQNGDAQAVLASSYDFARPEAQNEAAAVATTSEIPSEKQAAALSQQSRPHPLTDRYIARAKSARNIGLLIGSTAFLVTAIPPLLRRTIHRRTTPPGEFSHFLLGSGSLILGATMFVTFGLVAMHEVHAGHAYNSEVPAQSLYELTYNNMTSLSSPWEVKILEYAFNILFTGVIATVATLLTYHALLALLSLGKIYSRADTFAIHKAVLKYLSENKG